MAEYIEREKLLEILRYRGTQYAPKPFEGGFVSGWHEAIDEIESDVEDIPAADVRPERHGHIVIKSRVLGGVETYKCPQCYHKWQENKRARVDETLCSECGAVLAHGFQNYCPRCGAKMDGEDGNNDLHRQR